MLTGTLLVAIAIAAVIIWPTVLRDSPSEKDKILYRDSADKYKVPHLPAGLFFWVWVALYALITAASILYILDYEVDTPVDGNYMAVVALMFVNISLNHLWMNLFFSARSYFWAMVDTWLVFGTAVAILIMFAVTGHWTCFGVYIAYPIWLAIASVLATIWFAKVGEQNNVDKQAMKKFALMLKNPGAYMPIGKKNEL
jgi:tryptophan-rich sensory protein